MTHHSSSWAWNIVIEKEAYDADAEEDKHYE